MDAFEGHKTALIGDCDCTGDCKPNCEANGVQGFPTLKWGSADALESYEGERTYAALKKFADENLKPVCSPSNIDLCDADKKAEIAKFSAMSDADLEKLIEEGEAKIAEAESTFKEGVKGLQAQYEGMKAAQDEAQAAVKAGGLGLAKAVKSHKAKGGNSEL